MKKYYLIGKNISKSYSPIIHNKLFQIKLLPHQYQLYPQENQPPRLENIQIDNNFGGMSITIPYKKLYSKSKYILYGDHITQFTQTINTIVKDPKTNKLYAYNTDYLGIQKSLGQAIKKQQLETNMAIILGAGATSQTICYYCFNNNINVIIINRSQNNVNYLFKKYPNIKQGYTFQSIEQMSNQINYSILINTLPSDCKQYLSKIRTILPKATSKIIYFDVNYKNELNVLNLFNNIQKKIIKVQGLNMLIYQAIQQNRLFCKQQQYQNSQYKQYYNILSTII